MEFLNVESGRKVEMFREAFPEFKAKKLKAWYNSENRESTLGLNWRGRQSWMVVELEKL